MRRKLIRLVLLLLPAILAAAVCFAELTSEKLTGVISGKSLGTKKDMTWHCNIAADTDADFVLVAFEGSKMDPRKNSASVIWTEGLDRFNVIDFSIVDELCSWDKKKWEDVCEKYAAAVLDTLLEHFGSVKTVGVYAFSKGASAADAVCRKLRDAGLELSFVWLNDGFTTHDLPYVTELTESNEILLYNRFSRAKRVNGLCKNLNKQCGDLPNVDSRHISTYHGGLVKYETFAEELAAAIEKASYKEQ